MPGEIIPSREFYDYEAKYLDDGSKAVDSGADLPTRSVREVQRLSIAAFARSTAPGMARVDFLLARRQRQHVPQRGEHDPGIHDDQHVPEDVGGLGRLATRELVDRLIALALERHAEKQQLRTSIT